MGIQIENSVNYNNNSCAMQKSRSSGSVVHSVSKRLWRTRSRSSSRAQTTWTPQGSCVWVDGAGRSVRLADTSLLTLCDVERRALQQAALARLHQLNLGTTIKIPEENVAPPTKPKRRPHLLKRKALTTGFFEQSRKEADKDKDLPGGSVFGIPLTQCVETERALRRQHGGSHASLASLGAAEKGDDSESCDSSDWGSTTIDDGAGPRVPALVSACLAHLRRHGLRTVGLFRVSASKKRVRQLREEWERVQEAALDSAVCPHDVATLLKEFLRDLPDPLLCRDLYPAFLQTQKIRNRRLQWEAIRLIVQLLPLAHRDTLNALLSFLSQLADLSDDDHQPGNKMDAANLATIFAPNILHRNKPNEAAGAEQLLERSDVINVVRALVERQSQLWELPAELLHDAYIHLAHVAPAHLDALLARRAECASETAEQSGRLLCSREQLLHRAAASSVSEQVATTEKSYPRSRRTRDAASDTSSTSVSSAKTIVTRVRSSAEECGSSGVLCSPPQDSADSASEYNETLCGSDDDCVITASLHIPAAFPTRTSSSPRRRSSGSESSARRDSAVGSSPASATSSPPASPPPHTTQATHARLLHTAQAQIAHVADTRKGHDLHSLLGFSRERNTSDARAVILRQHDETPSKPKPREHNIIIRREEPIVRKDEPNLRRDDQIRRDQNVRKDEQNVRRDEGVRRDEQSLRKEDHNVKRDDSHRKDESVRRGEQILRRDEQNSRKEDNTRKDEQTSRREERKEGTTLYKRGELISSARSPT